MRIHGVPIQFDEDEKVIGGVLTYRQLGFLAVGFLTTLSIPFFLFFIPWYLKWIPMVFVVRQTIKFTFSKRFGWDYFDYWLKMRRCKKRQTRYVYRKSVR